MLPTRLLMRSNKVLLVRALSSRSIARSAGATTTADSSSMMFGNKNEIHHMLDDHFGYGVAKPLKVDEFHHDQYVTVPELADENQEPPTEKLLELQELVRQTKQLPKSVLRREAFYEPPSSPRSTKTHNMKQERDRGQSKKKNLVDPTKIHLYKRAHDENEFTQV